MRSALLYAILALGSISGIEAQPDFDHSHRLYGEVLARFVRRGLVDYGKLKSKRRSLDLYLEQLASVSEEKFRYWKREEQLAFLLNLYNAATLRLIIDHYPVHSIKEIRRFFKGPWDQKVVRFLDREITLNALEHKILRPEYKGPRIHFALVCAALGCPPLREEPYLPAHLERQLEDQGRRFFSESRKNRLSPEEGVVYLSPIFRWYEEDFIKDSGSVIFFVRHYFFPEASRGMELHRYEVRYTEYDWSLNDKRSGGGGP